MQKFFLEKKIGKENGTNLDFSTVYRTMHIPFSLFIYLLFTYQLCLTIISVPFINNLNGTISDGKCIPVGMIYVTIFG